MIKLEKIREDKKNMKLLFCMKGGNEVLANTIRRAILEEVPTLAVEDVEIKANSSALYDEVFALRLGLTPIKTDIKSYRLPKNQDEIEERSTQCTLQLRLKSSKNGYVYAEEAESSDPKCTFVYPRMPLVKLLPKQKVDVTMTAVMGQGKEHTKWTPGWPIYRKEALLKIGKVKDPENVLKHCTDGVLVKKGNSLAFVAEQAYESQLLDFYAELDEGITLEYTDNIIFSLESWGQLSCKEILETSADMLIEKTQKMEAFLAEK